MNVINDYQIIAKIYESSCSLVYRAVHNQDNRPIILKLLKQDYPTLPELTRYKQEYEITRSLNLDSVVKAYDLQRYDNSLLMMLEDFGGESLKIWMVERIFTLEEFLTIAIKITESLGAIHTANIIHKDINPSNIVFNPKTGQLKIIDFGISTILSHENQTICNPNYIEGTLAYISPEQTGRMNRTIDYRTDFYSLGVTFYELLTYQLPFKTTDPMELVHCHIAQQPVLPHLLQKEEGEKRGREEYCPKPVSDIVMKLMAKTAEDRYQNAWGLKADLEACLHQLQTTGEILDFALASQDISDKFHIPQKLYGRDEEVAQLLDTFERVSQGTTEIMLVAGYSGIGKSALVNEIHKPIVQKGGYFISGKFDQFQRNIPYASLIQAFQELLRQLLTESELQIKAWKQKLLDALGSNGQVIIDVISEIELIIGKQPPVPQLGLTESQNRFNLIFQRFISVFLKKEHPLVLFLDDLQWADLASLKLIELITTNSDSQYLLIIGAYRDNEVSEIHPLILLFERIQKVGIKVNNITLKPLTVDQINQLIDNSLKCSSEESKPLAKLVFNKTNGNPFFLTQVFQSLYTEKLLSFNFTTSRWQWNIEQIQAVGITDNVVELMISKIEKLDERTQNVLRLAACIGNKFNLEVLSFVNTKSLLETATELLSALQEDLIVPLNNNYKLPMLWNQEAKSIINLETSPSFIPNSLSCIPYKFLHDRVQQAAYALIPEDQKKQVHLKVGQLLLENTGQDKLEDNIFDIVNQLNIGAELIFERSQRNCLARLNLIAGRKAKNATAYESAQRYLEIGLGLLSSNSWEHQYDLTLALHVETVEAQYINTQFEKAEKLSAIVLQQAKALLDQVKVYELKIQSHIAKVQLHSAIDVAIQVLTLLGVLLTQKPSRRRIEEEQKYTELFLRDRQIEDLFDLPEMTDPHKLAAIRILLFVTSAAIITNPLLFSLVTLTAVNLCIKYGNPPQAAAVYIFYGKFLCGIRKDINSGYQFGQLSLKLLEKFNIQEFKSLVLQYSSGFIRHWKEPIRNSNIIETLLQAINIGLETGDIEHASYNGSVYCLFLMFTGANLKEVNLKYEKYIDLSIKLKQEYTFYYMKNCSKIALNLLNGYKNKCLVVADSQEEEEILLEKWTKDKAVWLIFSAYLAKAISSYFFKQYEEAVNSAIQCQNNAETSAAYIVSVQHNFYYSLALLAYYQNSEKDKYKEALKQVSLNQKNMKRWASYSSENCQHKYDLVEAEKARLLGQNWKADQLYNRAIRGARQQGYIQEEAIAHERAAEFYLALGREDTAQLYLKNAHYYYTCWGAIAKVKQLESEYSQLLVGITKRTEPKSISIASSTTGNNGEVLDLTTVIKASQALAGKIFLGKLLEKLMKIVIENAGAQKGFLILDKEDSWVIEAEGTVDSDEVTILQSIPIDSVNHDTRIPLLSAAIINYVEHTQENVVLNDAVNEGQFIHDPYIVATQPKSILCTPLLHQGKLSGILYLENNLTTGAFTSERIEILRILSVQAAISIENSRLYEQLKEYSYTLEQKVNERTEELQDKNQELAATLTKLKATQAQIVAQEKLASLGALTAGIAHEMKNPLNFVNNFAELSIELTEDLRQEIENQQDQLNPESKEYIKEILSDLSHNSQKINEHGKRADSIVCAMLMHSREQASERQMNVDLNFLLAEAVNLAYHGMQAKYKAFNMKIITNYNDDIKQVNVMPQNISRAFINLINNACYAVHLKKIRLESSGNKGEVFLPKLWVISRDLGDEVEVRIRDNGEGIPKKVLDKIFNPFFTTKPLGEGTGLGLSITHDIIVQHQGQIKVETEVGNHTEFIIILPKIQDTESSTTPQI